MHDNHRRSSSAANSRSTRGKSGTLWALALGALALLLSQCTSHSPKETLDNGEIGHASEALTARTIDIRLPQSLEVKDIALSANGYLRIHDGVQVQTAAPLLLQL